MAKKKKISIASLGKEEREDAWDDLYIKEDGVIVEFNADTKSGKIKSLSDDHIYNIESRELVRTKIELRPGAKVIFAPFQDSDGNNYARVIRIIELKT